MCISFWKTDVRWGPQALHPTADPLNTEHLT
jgi:hypothetical protein